MDKTKAQRNTAWRERKTRNAIVAPIEIDAGAFSAALVRKGLIQTDRPISREELAAYAGALIATFSETEES